MADIPLLVAFLGGLVSFLSPCVLPLIPGYLAYLSGTSLREGSGRSLAAFTHSLAFVLGFSVVFAVLGVLLNTVLEQFAYGAELWLQRIGGVVIIFFGLYLTGLIRIGFLEREHRFQATKGVHSGHLTSFTFGAAFAAGWTPCVGAVLGAILGLATTAPGSAFSLLMAYALGLGLPFLLVGAFIGKADRLLTRYAGAVRYVNLSFGIILIGLGILIFTGELNRLANFELLNRFLLQ